MNQINKNFREKFLENQIFFKTFYELVLYNLFYN